jgi:glutamate-5-semialdehyde dehydrogenase
MAQMANETVLARLTPGWPIPYGGNRVTYVTEELALAFQPGDHIVVVQATGQLLHIPASEHRVAAEAVDRACAAFSAMGLTPDSAISEFFEAFARRLEDDGVWAEIAHANAVDVASAQSRGRSTTRLAVSEKMRRDMAAGLRQWRDAPARRGQVAETIQRPGWRVEQVFAPLGVVGFVFEGRPNVFADATGVLRGGNTVAFRIGSDALGTAKAVMAAALNPALRESHLPEGAASLVESADRAAGWAMFSDPRLALAVARGSGRAVAQLGAVARQAGVPVSLHGTGGAWIVADPTADAARFAAAILNSLDRKVCNSLNVCCIARKRVDQLVPLLLRALERAGERRGQGYRLHVVDTDRAAVPDELFSTRIKVRRASGDVEEPIADLIPEPQLAHEWEWEETPEISLKVVESTRQAIDLFNRYSPQFIASLITEDVGALKEFNETVNAPFTGNGYTRWVDGQYALGRPELGLSNWQNGRLFGRGGILSGDGVYTIRTHMVQDDPDVRR